MCLRLVCRSSTACPSIFEPLRLFSCLPLAYISWGPKFECNAVSHICINSGICQQQDCQIILILSSISLLNSSMTNGSSRYIQDSGCTPWSTTLLFKNLDSFVRPTTLMRQYTFYNCSLHQIDNDNTELLTLYLDRGTNRGLDATAKFAPPQIQSPPFEYIKLQASSNTI